MQVSSELLWAMMRKNNALIVKTKTLCFTKDPFSANNQHSRRNLGNPLFDISIQNIAKKSQKHKLKPYRFGF